MAAGTGDAAWSSGIQVSRVSVHPMSDILYVAGSVAFFALMLGYVAACARLGRAAAGEERSDEPR